ncbi:ribonuclease E/G [Puniceibacterium confluentis]|uniref:ribonuclease E/G n=1 Tax=Puniceibacterium confluentis TaxID=1958944 RepID=UPI0011B8354D|nr:ribonuclease E/G [Puniceibacterium confluentis]
MKGRTIALDHLNGSEAAALMVDGILQDLLVDTDLPRPGTIYRAIAMRPMKGQGGMFLNSPDGPCYLRQIKGLAAGQPLLVQVTGYAEPGKAIPVTTKILFKSRHAIVTPDAPGFNISRSIRDEEERVRLIEIAHEAMDEGSHGLILRSSCAGADRDEIAEDIQAMADLANTVMQDTTGEAETLVEGDSPHALAWREWSESAEIDTEAGSFETQGVLDAIEELRSARVRLGEGAMFIEPTRALIAVDINTGGDTTPAAGLKVNLAAMKDLPRQLRLRGLGGQITIDMAPVPKKDRRTIESALRAALKLCTIETTLVGWTPMGNLELQRKRDRIALSQVLG